MGVTMNKSKLYVRSAMLTVLLATLVASRVALAVDESEPNDPYTSAQALTIGSDGTVTVTNASIYNTQTVGTTPGHRDVDFYSFHGTTGDLVTFNIDSSMNVSSVAMMTTLGVWGPDPATNILPLITQTGSNCPDIDNLTVYSPGLADACIEKFQLPATGTYIVGVSTDPGEFVDINTIATSALSGMGWSPNYGVSGAYTLTISGVTPYTAPAPAPAPPPVATVLPVNIDIMPGRHHVIWLRSAMADFTTPDRDADRKGDLDREMRHHFRGGIPVALLSTETFNAMDVDQSQLRFGSTGDEDSLIRCSRHGVDVDHNGHPDLLCFFDPTKADFKPGDANGIMIGETNSGADFKGQGYLKVVTGREHRERDRERHGERHEHRHRH